MSDFLKRLFNGQSGQPEGGGEQDAIPKEPFSEVLDVNTKRFEDLFQYPLNSALKQRELQIPSVDRRAMVLFVDGASDSDKIAKQVIQPLLELKPKPGGESVDHLVDELKNNVLTISGRETIGDLNQAVAKLINGSAILLIDGEKQAIAVETAGFENRSVAEPSREIVIKGPKSAFVESSAINQSLIRRQVKDHRLVSETMTVGSQSPQEISVLYMSHIADPQLVENVKEKISQVDRDAILTLSQMEELLEVRPYSLFPSTMTTERPDRAGSFLLEGHVVLLMDNSPDALIAPITFWSLYHTAEDQFLRWAYGNFARIIRLCALFFSLLMPAIYLAVVTFHPEMIPTDLMLAIAASRERVPFPTLLELLLLELTFEILREAGIRVPTPLGTTIGIVGALILGQAAVQANLVSPLLVVVIAITGLSSFAIPDVGLSVMTRILRFTFVLSAHLMGFVGIALTFAVMLAYATSIKSFGVPFFAPLAPHMPSSRDLFLRPIVRKQWLRPLSMKPRNAVRAKPEGGDRP
ncbi:spore germination protein [Bhargavaea beijingensis]|uniref:Spore germination protein n=1 Tax=Bhargavaea beijingensis TaxID=426756 RepID=A0A1G6Y6B6_9BACL|nr:spore germination protein [Bhargavaea beijingensis]MCW1927834.1 spore germination protein [Bhargavaea beijingensis]RSK31919.1 spore germination protein [Bhargavaea beijingensis]SDD85821.1 spore germination protein KA [Bhargavaea beijingensis]